MKTWVKSTKKGGEVLAQLPVPESICALWLEQSKAAGERGKESCKKDISGGMCKQKEVVTFHHSCLTNCAGGKAGIAIITPCSKLQFGVQLYTNCTN